MGWCWSNSDCWNGMAYLGRRLRLRRGRQRSEGMAEGQAGGVVDDALSLAENPAWVCVQNLAGEPTKATGLD